MHRILGFQVCILNKNYIFEILLLVLNILQSIPTVTQVYHIYVPRRFCLDTSKQKGRGA